MDVAMFFPGTQVIQDRYAWRIVMYYSYIRNHLFFEWSVNSFSRGHGVPTLDPQQDFCVMRTNVTDRSFYVAFERFMITNDVNDIALNTNIFPMFALGPYTYTAATNTYQPSIHSYRLPIAISVNLLSCTSCKNIDSLSLLSNVQHNSFDYLRFFSQLCTDQLYTAIMSLFTKYADRCCWMCMFSTVTLHRRNNGHTIANCFHNSTDITNHITPYSSDSRSTQWLNDMKIWTWTILWIVCVFFFRIMFNSN